MEEFEGIGFCTERSSASPGDGLEAGDRSQRCEVSELKNNADAEIPQKNGMKSLGTE